MKSNPLAIKGTQSDFADLIGVGPPAVTKMVRSGVLRADVTLAEWLLDYCSHVREQAAGRQAQTDGSLTAERARLAKEQADRIEMQNAVTRKVLAPVTLVEEVLAKAGSRVAGILDGIPGVIRRREPSTSDATLLIVEEEVARARNIAAAVRLEDILEDDEAEQELLDA